MTSRLPVPRAFASAAVEAGADLLLQVRERVTLELAAAAR